MIYWDDAPTDQPQEAQCKVVDLAFALQCSRQPVQHTVDLNSAVISVLPWFELEPLAALHLIHTAASGNGWQSPTDDGRGYLILSKRAKLILRVPVERIEAAKRMENHDLKIGKISTRVGLATVRHLTPSPALYVRYLVAVEDESEEGFLLSVRQQLAECGVTTRKMICGRSHYLQMGDREVYTRSLMLADLTAEQAIRLQERGLGNDQKFGCGIFIPHKDIKAIEVHD